MHTDTITAASHCVVDDGQTLSLYARPAGEVRAELNALEETDDENPGMAYSLWCADHAVEMTTGTGDDPAEILAIAEERGLRTIRYDESAQAWV